MVCFFTLLSKNNHILHMNQRSSDGAKFDHLKVFVGMLIAYIVLQMLKRGKGTGDDETFSYIARTSAVDAVIGTEGLSVNDILGDGTIGDGTTGNGTTGDGTTGGGVTDGECISRNVFGEFTGELTDEQALCITYSQQETCVEPCLWYTRDRDAPTGSDEDLADIDESGKACARDPVGGVCAAGFALGTDGCCNLRESVGPSHTERALDMGLEIAKGEVGGVILAMSPAILKFLAGEGLTKGGELAMKRGFKALGMGKEGVKLIAKVKARLATKMGVRFGAAKVTKIGGKLATRVGSKVMARAALATARMARILAKKLATTMAVRAGAKLASIAAKATSVIAAPLAIIDIFSMVLDMGDPRGYNTFAENAVIQQAREMSEYMLNNFASTENIEYPFTFPLTTAFPLAWQQVVSPALESRYLNAAMTKLSADHLLTVFEALLDEADFPDDVNEAIGMNLIAETNRDPVDRDNEVYRVLTTGQVVTGVRWVDTGRSKPSTGRQLTHTGLVNLLRRKIPTETRNLGLARAVQRYGGLIGSLPFLSKEEKDVNPFVEDIVLTPEEMIEMNSFGMTFDAFTYVEVNGAYFVSSDIGVPGRFIHHCTHMITTKRQGVSLSMEGVKWWNAWHKEEWFTYNDLFQRPPDMPENYQAPPVAVWSDEYLVLDEADPGTSDKPNMLRKKLGAPAALYLPAGHIVAYCEKKRDAAFFGGLMGQDVPDANDGVDPTKFGVYFDDGTGELGGVGCVYTSKYCTRMGMKHKYNHQSKISDCYLDGAQAVAEGVLGSTIVRGASELGHNALGFVCDPECSVTDFCEGRKCYPKKSYGQSVGITADWKCLSGAEHWGKCTECKVATDCDGYTKETSKKGIDCPNGKCYCNKDTLCERKRESCTTTDKSKCDHNTVYCDNNSWCTSGFCDIVVGQPNVCRKTDTELSRADGEFCNVKDNQCASGLCAHHKCEPKIKACKTKDCWQTLGTATHPCNRDNDCEDGAYCRKVAAQRNTCRLKPTEKNRPNGEYCDSDRHDKHGQCASNYCNDWKCKPRKDSCLQTNKKDKRCNDKHCHEGQECKSGFCDIVVGQPNRCRRADTELSRANGEFCNVKDNQCASKLCAHHKCEPRIKACKTTNCWQTLGTATHPCNRDIDCEDGAYCRKVAGQRNTCRLKPTEKNRPNGEYCDAQGQCSSGICHGYICRQCSTNSHCDSNEFCSGYTCHKKGGHTSSCASDSQCTSGTCSHFTHHNHNKGIKQCCNGHGQWYTWAGGPQLCKNQPRKHVCTYDQQCAGANAACDGGFCTTVKWTPCSNRWWANRNGGPNAQCKANGLGRNHRKKWRNCGWGKGSSVLCVR